MAWRSIEGENLVIKLTSIRERVSASGLTDLLTCLMSEVNWETKSRCRTCRGEYRFGLVEREYVSRLVRGTLCLQ